MNSMGEPGFVPVGAVAVVLLLVAITVLTFFFGVGVPVVAKDGHQFTRKLEHLPNASRWRMSGAFDRFTPSLGRSVSL